MPYTMEGYEYVDTGCKLHPSCLQCPLPRCVYDAPPKRGNGSAVQKAKLVVKNEKRDAEMRQLRSAGVPVTEIAKRFSVTRIRVYQVTSS